MNTQTWAVTNTFVVAMYYRIFFQVGLVNEFLRQTTDAMLDARGNVSSTLRADIATYRAEARFLRALSYWHGIDLFGDIPLLTEDDPLGSTPPQQATRRDLRLHRRGAHRHHWCLARTGISHVRARHRTGGADAAGEALSERGHLHGHAELQEL
jgi:hypothetical protein